MRVTIQTSDPRPIYVQIMDEVRRALVVGSLGSDDPLPSVRELASELRVNPNTVSQAYRELERDGVVYTRRGRGTFIATDARPDDEERRALARDVARRALVDAHRAGLGVAALVEALNEIADASPDGTRTGTPGAPPATSVPSSSTRTSARRCSDTHSSARRGRATRSSSASGSSTRSGWT